MRLNRLTIATILLFASCTPKPKHPTYTWNGAEKLNGHIKQIVDSKFDSMHDTVVTDFDEQGNIINEREVFENQSREYLYTNIFNEKGNLHTVIITHKGWGNLSDSTIWDLTNGFIMRSHNTEKNLPITVLYSYNKKGYLSQTYTYYGKRLNFTDKFTYNDRNLIIEDDLFSYLSERIEKTHPDRQDPREYYSVDQKGNWTKMANGADTITRKITYY